MAEERERTAGIGISRAREHMLDAKSVVSGFLSGGLVLGGIILPLGFANVLLFLIGIYVLLDTVIQYGRMSYPVQTIVSFITGGVVVSVAVFSGYGTAYLIVIIILTLLVYLRKIKRFYHRRLNR